MSKSIGAAGEFTRLFKNTRVAQLPQNLGKLGLDRSKAFPTHQVVEALPSSFSRRDFGIKLRLPKKIKTRRIVINDLDNKYGLPDIEPLNGFYWKKLRFREFGIPVKVKGTGLSSLQKVGSASSPLFPSKESSGPDKTTTISSALNVRRQSLYSQEFQKKVKPELRKLRRPFVQWLVKKYPDRLVNSDLSNEIIEFLGEVRPQIGQKNEQNGFEIPSSYSEKLSGTAGLSYTLGGRLLQTPNGVESSKVLPGRFLQSRITGHHFGLGGFVGYSSASQSQVKYLNKLGSLNKPITGTDKFSREFKVPIVPKHAYINLENRKLELDLDPVRSMKRYGKKNGTSLSSIKKSISPRSPLSGNDKETSVLNSLLGLLESVDKK
ncbi:DEKNAAC102101 [Brettanomyces naardenensis]|uniref:DEKNAAC102101 n=1 Tax=Brettanomyces naardenensis TaxID=13370 RepID=A0A448YJT1_BRENA|nr:DEKNAAC102101 [Brettanomyces naardenensis]